MSKTILLGVTGSIAAYKAADLASRLTQSGQRVVTLMTASAQKLISPSTFLNLTGNPCYTDLWETKAQTEHIALTDEADLFLLAPATANSIAKLAHGLADDMVSTTLLAVDCPVLVCPAMNVRMWNNKVVQDNLARVRELGHQVLEPGAGHLACGHIGAGRLAEPDEIAAAALALLAGQDPLAANAQLFFEILTLEASPSVELLNEEEAYRAQARKQGGLLLGGPLGSKGSNRFGYLHRAANLDAAMERARQAPLSRGSCRIEVFPWKAGATRLPSAPAPSPPDS